MPGASDWLSWDRYETTLISSLRQYAHFIVSYDLRPRIASTSVVWRGRLYCEGAFEVAINQRQDVRRSHGRIQVRTVRYSYQVLVRQPTLSELVRYDNFHVHPGHSDAHHAHRYVGAALAPNLVDVLAEAESLWRGRR